MFVSRKGTGSAIGVLSGGQLKIANGVNTHVAIQRVGRYAWEVKAHDVELDQTAMAVLELTKDPFHPGIALTWYMMRFHGEPRFVFEK